MKLFQAIVLASISCTLIGCTQTTTPSAPATSSGHDHQLESLAAGVEQLKGFRDDVKAAFDAGNPSDCDNALHEAAHVLEALPAAGDVSSMSAEDQEVIKAESKTLFSLFMKIHDGFHDGGEVETNAYEAVADEMNASLETLSSKIPSAAP